MAFVKDKIIIVHELPLDLFVDHLQAVLPILQFEYPSKIR
jgi:hypothetical protein